MTEAYTLRPHLTALTMDLIEGMGEYKNGRV